MIDVYYNDAPTQTVSGSTLKDFLESQGIDSRGTGVAVNNVFIRQINWNNYLLKQGDKITVIRATFGG